MRSLLLLAAVCCLVLSAWASPISRAEEDKDVAVPVARQSAAPAPAATDDDDDDDDDEDDDDDDIDLGGDDDEDDDDEEEADDEEDDYLERFIDEILGGGDDEDDDEEETVATVSQPVAAAAETVAAAPAAASAEEVANAAESEGEAAEGELEGAEEPAAGQKEPASETEAASSEVAAAAAEEDDEEEDDITDALDPEADDDDEDDEEEEDDEDDDDDDDITDALGRNISAKHSRALSEPVKKQAVVPAIYIVKYNKFVDTILEKMNDVLRQSYDPVSVKLQPIDASKKSGKPKKNKSKNKRKSSNKKKNTARGEIKPTPPEFTEKTKEENQIINEVKPESAIELIQNASESRALDDKVESSKAKPTANKTKLPTKTQKPPTKQTKPKPKPPSKLTTKKPTTTKNKTKTSAKSKPRAKGTLYGLSSLKRTGDVTVNIMSNHTTVKSNFAVGPLILRVEKVVGRGAKKEVKSATATTAEMAGKLSLRINNQGVATLHSIKVLQPKQVRVDSNHERTRELVWRRSARIAHVVSEKLLSASKPMFQQAVVKQ